VSQGFLAWAWSRTGEPRRGLRSWLRFVSIQRAAHFIWSEVFTPFSAKGIGRLESRHARQTLEELLDIAERMA